MGHRGFSTRDQGSQFTSRALVGLVQGFRLQLGMDGKGRRANTGIVERLWKSVKCEEVYLHAYDSVSLAWQGLQRSHVLQRTAAAFFA